MDSNAPNPPKMFWKFPLYLSRIAFVLAIVPLVMVLLCIVTGNSFIALIDLYYCFVTPIQICEWSVALALILSLAASILAGYVYFVDGKFCDEYYDTKSLSSRTLGLVIFELIMYFWA